MCAYLGSACQEAFITLWCCASSLITRHVFLVILGEISLQCPRAKLDYIKFLLLYRGYKQFGRFCWLLGLLVVMPSQSHGGFYQPMGWRCARRSTLGPGGKVAKGWGLGQGFYWAEYMYTQRFVSVCSSQLNLLPCPPVFRYSFPDVSTNNIGYCYYLN